MVFLDPSDRCLSDSSSESLRRGEAVWSGGSATGFESRLAWVEVQVPALLGAGYSLSLSFSFLIYKMGIITSAT